jgi:hypothetical protein
MKIQRLIHPLSAVLFGLFIVLPQLLHAAPIDNWHSRITLPSGNYFNGITYGNNTFVAVGVPGIIFTSPDGATWTQRYSVPSYAFTGVAYGNGTFVAMEFSGIILFSTDGVTWTETNLGTNTDSLSGLTYVNNTFLVFDNVYDKIYTSPDGETWTEAGATPFPGATGMTYANNTFVAWGCCGNIATSPDGVSWTQRDSGTAFDFYSVTYANNTFVAVGGYGNIATSPDGETWTQRNCGLEEGFCEDLYEVTYANDTFVAVGYADEFRSGIFTSPDGATWTQRNYGNTHSLTGVAYGNNTFVVVGDDSTILQSDPLQLLQFVIQPGPEGKDTFFGTAVHQEGDPNGDNLDYGGWVDYYYDFIEFDLTNAPPTDIVITAKLYLFSFVTPPNDPGLIVNRITESWTETGVNFWSNPASTFYTNIAPIVDGWNVVDITDLYKGWKSNAYPNYGIMLSPKYKWQTNGSFYSSDSPYPDLRPKLVVEMTNIPPVLNPIGNKSVNEGETLQFTVTASDPDGNDLTYSASNLPTGASIDPSTRTFSWTPSFDQAGSYLNVLFMVTDNGTPPQSASESITINVGNVNRPPVLNSIGNKTVNVGETLQFTVTATDPDGDSLIYSASNLPTGAIFDPSTKAFTWTPASGQAGSYAGVHFEVIDGSLVSSENILITVTNLADLTGEWSVPPTYARNSTKGTLLVRNIGTTRAVRFTVVYYLSNDAARDADDSPISTKKVASLAPGTSISLNFSYRASAQGMYIIAVIDSDGQVAESNEGNNVVPSDMVPLPSGGVHLISPNGGELWASGSQHTISLETYLPKGVSVDLYYSIDGGVSWKGIVSNIPVTVGGGAYAWTVPVPISNQTQCKVRVDLRDAGNNLIGSDLSDGYFTISVVRVTWPNGGETLVSGSAHAITWERSLTQSVVANVRLYYTLDGGVAWNLIAIIPGNPGIYPWSVPAVALPQTRCMVMVSLEDAFGHIIGSDESDSFFTISP